MPKPKERGGKLRSRRRTVRLHPAEDGAVMQLAATLGQTPSQLIRRLIREAINGGPDYFKGELLDLRRMQRELAAIGRNLNQLSRAANRGVAVGGDDVRRVINAGIVQMEAVKGLYDRAVEGTVKRVVRPLYQEAGLSLPQGEAGKDQGGGGPSKSQAPRKSARAL